MADISKIKIPTGDEYDIKDNNAIENITRSGNTFTATRRDGTTFTFSQKDNNTTYTPATTVSAIATAAVTGTSTAYARADHVHNITKDVVTAALGYTPPTTNTTYTVASATPSAVSTAGAVGTSAKYAREDHVHAIALATGDANGQVKIAGTNVSVKGLGSNAYSSTTYAPLNSPGLTGTPTAPTAADGTNNNQIATTQFVMSAFKANDAMIFKGTIGTGGTVTALPNTHSQGWTYRVITAGTYAGKVCEIGDMIICVIDGTAANNDHWTVVQTNIDGAVTGPASATDNAVAIFNGTSGKVIKNSGFTIGTSVPANAKFTDTTYTFTDGNPTLAWGTKSTVGTAGGVDFHVTMPANPNTDTKNTTGSTDTSSKIFLIGATSQAANPKTYSDDEVYATSGVLQTKNTQATAVLAANTANSGNAGGLALYGTSPTDYGIAFRQTSNGGKHGGVQGDWAQYHYMTGATNRGWVFKHSSGGNVTSIDGIGNAVFNGYVTIGGNATNTSGCKQQYNETTQALDFIFA